MGEEIDAEEKTLDAGLRRHDGMMRYLTGWIIALAVVGIAAGAFGFEGEILNISGDAYFPAVKAELVKARASIHMAMYLVEASGGGEHSRVNQLVDELIAAKKRGVDVEVVLDQDAGSVKNRAAYRRLKDAGVRVAFDERARYLHAKAIVIDGGTVIAGSTNWSGAALDGNVEVSLLVRSEGLAQDILKYFGSIKIDTSAAGDDEDGGTAVRVARGFLEDRRLAPLMVKRHDERALDVYLFLLWKAGGKAEGPVTVYYDEVAKYLGIYEGWSELAYRRQVIRTYRKLEGYGVIGVETRWGKEAKVTLFSDKGLKIASAPAAPRNDGGVVSADADAAYFKIPEGYFTLGWGRVLSLRGKFCYMVNLSCAQASETRPVWSKSLAEIIRQFGGVGHDVVSKGMGELRRRKLIEVSYDALTEPYDERAPKRYTALRLYDPAAREAQVLALEPKYGAAVFAQARDFAAVVFEEWDPDVIEDVILKMREYGEARVREAFAVVGRMKADNPKRTWRYAVGVLEGMGVTKQNI